MFLVFCHATSVTINEGAGALPLEFAFRTVGVSPTSPVRAVTMSKASCPAPVRRCSPLLASESERGYRRHLTTIPSPLGLYGMAGGDDTGKVGL